MEKAFSIKKLNLYYGENQALKNISLDIMRFEVTAFIGPSGCGKSTLLRCLNRMNDLIPNVKIDGEIHFEEMEIVNNKIDVVDLRTRVGMVFQKPNPFPMSIYENIVYGLRCQGIKNKQTLDKVCEQSLKRAALWEEVKDRLKDSAYEDRKSTRLNSSH